VATEPSFNTPVVNVSGTSLTSASANGLLNSTTYYWRVRASNLAGNSDWSAAWSFTTQAQVVQPGLNLVGHWKMDEPSGNTLTDHSGNGNNATLLSTSGVGRVTGREGLAIALPGTNNRYATAPHSGSLNITGAITVSAWIRPNDVHTRKILTKTGPGGYDLGLSSGGKVSLILNGTSAQSLQSNTSYPSDGSTWMHVAATFDGSTATIYVNGQPDASRNLGAVAIGSNTSALHIGALLGGSNRFNGAIDDLRLYSRALSAAEIASLAGTGQALRVDPLFDKGGDKPENDAMQVPQADPDPGIEGRARLYPNPVDKVLNISLSGIGTSDLEIAIFDSRGVMLLNGTFGAEQGSLSIDLGPLNLRPGLHVVVINHEGTRQSLKFIKK
jgi:hypothetical protein